MDLCAPKGTGEGRAINHVVAVQVFLSNEATPSTHFLYQRLSHSATVESLLSSSGNFTQRPGEVFLYQQLPLA